MSMTIHPSALRYIEALQTQYEHDPDSLDASWRYFFDGLTFGGAERPCAEAGGVPSPESREDLEHEVKAIELIQSYREMAYLIADVNPLDRSPKTHPLLALENFGLKESDLDKKTHVGQLLGLGIVTLREIIEALKTFYCSPIAVDIAHIEDPKSRQWIQRRVESKLLCKPIPELYKKRTLEKLAQTEALETFIHKRFVGQKRFSIEGNDVLIPMLDYLIDQAGALGADEILFGMAHRGRLNVLANIFGKDIKAMFAEFAGNVDADASQGDGDVKYHLGYSSDIKSASGKDIHISLAPNPSHLEAINSVVMGMTRSKQKIKGDLDRTHTLAVLLHGDASFAGQGSIYEVLNMSELQHYTVGGTIHIIVNNQIGFTTDPESSRSTPNASDIAKMLEIPIFRVNADEPDAALRAISLALQYRYTFKRDVVIDLVGYRRYGHNEGDEPNFVHPVLYKNIAAHPRVRQIYADHLIGDGIVSTEEPEQQMQALYERYEQALQESKKGKVSPKMAAFGKRWSKLRELPSGEAFFEPVNTALTVPQLKEIARTLVQVPSDFHLHPKIKRFIEDRVEMIEEKRGIDWSTAESLAFGSLMRDGYMVRLAGQDCIRGTFSQRHSAFYDTETNVPYMPLQHLEGAKADVEIFNSLLSEMGALGFEFGQSLANPYKLTLWEAQFGDFANGAQIIIDQFISCSAVKWQRYSGLVMLLPHGYEGQGPEHSSARLERFLQLCAQHNMQVCNFTTPAQYFHALRRQMVRDFRSPLIIMTPKSLLRHPKAVSEWREFEQNTFQEIIDDSNESLKKTAKRIILCSGKIYYDLVEARDKTNRHDIAIIRVEQLYPFPRARWTALFASYKALKEVIWCQEEPQNMGSWFFMLQYLPASLDPLGKDKELRYVGRGRQASPSHGYMHLHHSEQEKIVLTALGEL